MKRSRLLDSRILLVAGVIIVILLMSDFTGRMSELHQLTQQRSTVRVRVTQLSATLEVLQVEKAYATSVAAVAKWAREEGHYIQPDDHPIVAQPPADATPVPTVVVVSTMEPVANWQIWYTLFLGN